MLINQEIENIIKRYKDKTFIKDLTNKKEISFEKFYERSALVCNYFQSLKIKQGSRILVQMENSIEYFYVIFACLLGGYVVCPIDTEIKDEKIKKLEKIIKPSLKIRKKIDVKFYKNNINIVRRKVPYIIIFTSGTTGEPKGIQISNFAYLGSAISYSKLAGYDNETNLLHFLPIYYNAGILNTFYSCFFAGSQITLANKISAINIINFWENILEDEINSFHLTPEIANALSKLKIPSKLKQKISKIKIISTGSYLHQNIVDKFEKIYMVRILSCYGLTEIGGPLTIQNWENTFIEGSVGHHSNEVKIKIVNIKNDKHIHIKTPYIMDNYINEKGKIDKPKLKNGFFDTGDIGEYKKGELIILGRRKDIVKKGAEIISLAYIENEIMKSKIVDDVIGIAKYDIDKGSKIYMFVKLKQINNLDSDINFIFKYLKKKLKKIEIPDKIIPVPVIPKTYNGKAKKEVLEKLYF